MVPGKITVFKGNKACFIFTLCLIVGGASIRKQKPALNAASVFEQISDGVPFFICLNLPGITGKNTDTVCKECLHAKGRI